MPEVEIAIAMLLALGLGVRAIWVWLFRGRGLVSPWRGALDSVAISLVLLNCAEASSAASRRDYHAATTPALCGILRDAR
jgi:hypothetical protein